LIITAAANDSYDEDIEIFDVRNTVTDPATAKNVIAVGAQDSWGSSLNSGAYGPGFVAFFSSRGPTADGRMKPDIMAPGFWVLSAGAQPDQKGECDSDPLPDIDERGRGGLTYRLGTSMATPVVSGSAAKIRQWFRDGYYPSGMKNSDHAVPNPSGADEWRSTSIRD
jgi:subtilisin family serine protease